MSPNNFSCGCHPPNPTPVKFAYSDDPFTKVTVKFRLDAEHTIAQVYEAQWSVYSVIRDLAAKFNVGSVYIELTHQEMGRSAIDGNLMVGTLPHNEYGMIELDLGLNELIKDKNEKARRESEKIRLDLEVFYRSYQLPVCFSVQVEDSVDKRIIAKQLVVDIVNKPIEKSFVGGYRNKRTNIEYHDAFSQTGPNPDCMKWDGIISQTTQTICERDTFQNTHHDHSSQAFGSATKLIHIPSSSDYTIIPGKYETHHEMTARINLLAKVRLIQRNFRRYLLQKLVRETAAEYRRLFGNQCEREYLRTEELPRCYKAECTKKSFPKTREDFNLLIVQIHKWKQREILRINETSWDEPRVALLSNLLHKEIELLNTVEKKYFAVRKNSAAKREDRLLHKMGEPVRWIGYKNIVCEMDLLRTQKIRLLIDMHEELKQSTKKENRIVVIAKAFEILEKEPSSTKRNELVALLQREVSLLPTKMSTSNLETLRLRQSRIWVDLIKSYDRNLTTIPKAPSTTKRSCKSCKRVLPVTEFHKNTMQPMTNVCTRCIHLKDPPTDFTVYRVMLRQIRRDERRRSAMGSYAFIAQENDIRVLIDQVWLNRSILSNVNVHTELRLPRWRKEDDWSPWNCICLTEDEAQAHKKMKHIEDLYDDHFIHVVMVKHEQARLMFKKMNRLNRNFVESTEWWRVGMTEGAI